jgi:hypothetical protein
MPAMLGSSVWPFFFAWFEGRKKCLSLKNIYDTSSTFPNSNHRTGDQKIGLQVFRPNIPFFNLFSPKNPNKHP